MKIRKGTSGLPEQVERAARGVLGDMSLVKRFQYVEELDRELKRYDKADAAWKSTNIAQTVFADLTLQRSLAVNEAGDLARRRIKRLTDELAQLIKRVIKIEYEILQGEKGDARARGHRGAAIVTRTAEQPSRAEESAPTTSTSSGRSPASTGATSSATTASRSATSASATRPKARRRRARRRRRPLPRRRGGARSRRRSGAPYAVEPFYVVEIRQQAQVEKSMSDRVPVLQRDLRALLAVAGRAGRRPCGRRAGAGEPANSGEGPVHEAGDARSRRRRPT